MASCSIERCPRLSITRHTRLESWCTHSQNPRLEIHRPSFHVLIRCLGTDMFLNAGFKLAFSNLWAEEVICAKVMSHKCGITGCNVVQDRYLIPGAPFLWPSSNGVARLGRQSRTLRLSPGTFLMYRMTLVGARLDG